MTKPLSTFYDSKFFAHQVFESVHSSGPVIEVIHKFIRPQSVLDVGCGVGAWARAFIATGVPRVVGIDGPWVLRSTLLFPASLMITADLSREFRLDERFDLAICLEVAEHLDESSADTLIEALVCHGRVVAFSAAVPGQGGTGHHNEQWPAYWMAKFGRHGYQPYDVLRPILFAVKGVSFWYAQNIVFYVSPDAISSGLFTVPNGAENWGGASLVHPGMLQASRRAARVTPKRWLRYAVTKLAPDIFRRLLGQPPVGGD